MAVGEIQGIPSNDLIYVDTDNNALRIDEIYLVYQASSDSKFRPTLRKCRKIGNDLWLMADNVDQSTYPPLSSETTRILGRVRWF